MEEKLLHSFCLSCSVGRFSSSNSTVIVLLLYPVHESMTIIFKIVHCSVWKALRTNPALEDRLSR